MLGFGSKPKAGDFGGREALKEIEQQESDWNAIKLFLGDRLASGIPVGLKNCSASLLQDLAPRGRWNIYWGALESNELLWYVCKYFLKAILKIEALEKELIENQVEVEKLSEQIELMAICN